MGFNETTLNFVTKYDSAGADAAVRGNQNLGKSLNDLQTAASNTGTNWDGLIRRIERPLSVVAYSGIANELMDMGNKGESATQMLEKGLHAAGNALLFFEPELGIAVIAGTALFEVLMRISDKTHVNAEETGKHADALLKDSEAAKSAATDLLKLGTINETQAKQLKDISVLKEKELQDLRNSISAQEKEATARVISTKAILDEGKVYRGVGQTLKENYLIALKEELTLKNALIALGSSAKKEDKTPTDNTAIFQKQKEIMNQLTVSHMTMAQAVKDEKEQKAALNALEQQIVSNTDPKILKNLEAEYDLRMKNISTDKERQSTIKSENSDWKDWSDITKKSFDAFSNGLDSTNGSTTKALQDLKKTVLKETGDMLIKKLNLQAIADSSNPFTAFIALAEIAAISTIASLAGASGGTSASSPASSSPSAASPSLGPPVNSANGPQQSGLNMTVVLQGQAFMDGNMMQQFLGNLNDFVQSRNGQLVATHYVSQSGTVTSLAS